MKNSLLLSIFLSAPLLCFAESEEGSQMSFTTRCGRQVTVTAVTPNILRVDNVPAGTAVPGVQSVLPLETQEDAAMVSFDEATGTHSLVTQADIIASYNPRSGMLTLDGGTPGSIVLDRSCRGKEGNTVTLTTTAAGSFYGAGERGHDFNLRGDTLVMYNRQNYGYTGSDPRISQMNITMPLFLSTDGYAIVFDDYAAAKMVMSNPIVYSTESPRPVSYYFISGVRNLAGLTEQLTSLTGRQELAPFWSLGYITSKYGYRTQAETEGTIDTLKRQGYPVDGIVLDLYWYGREEDMGRLEWDPEQWPNARKMLASLNKKGVKLIPISQPYVLRNGRAIDNYNTLAPQGLFVADSTGTTPQEVKIWVGEGGMFDVSNPATRAWLAQRYKELTDMGVGGWWGDLGEPEVHPESAMHNNGLNARLYHNMYGNDWSSIIYDLYKQEYPSTRLMTLMRGGTTGLQRYSVFPWSTDVSRSWGGLEPQVRIMLNSGLSGLGYMSHDVGGFAVDPENPIDPELYVRWLQLGLFSPVLRTHAQAKPEPYHYTELQDIVKPIILERYRWLPYNYTLAWENATMGYPLVRPLNFYGGPAYDNVSDEYLWGEALLVAPVMTKGATQREVVLPAGSTWMDFRNPNIRYAGGETITYDAPLDVLPLFVRENSFIPLADYKMENTGDYRSDRFTVHYYPMPGGHGSYTLYDDDRLSATSLEDGNYRLLKFDGSMNEDNLRTRVEVSSTGSYPGAPRSIELTLVIHGIPSGVLVAGIEGAKGKIDINKREGTATAKFRYTPGTKAAVELSLTTGARLQRAR